MAIKYLRQTRQFSPTLKTSIVKRIDTGRISPTQVSREYSVSLSTVYRWIYNYSMFNQRGTIMVVDKKTNDQQTELLKQRIAELERIVGTKQMQLDYYQEYSRGLEQEVPESVKKKWESKLYTDLTGKNKRTDGQ
jgi:transposase-like protein